MAIGVTLLQLRSDLRAECGQTMNMAQMTQAQAAQDQQLNRQQRELWDAYDWPHLAYWTDIPVEDGQSVFNFPTNMPFDQINKIYWAAKGDTQWKLLDYGIRAYDEPPVGVPVTFGTPERWSNKVTVAGNVTDPAGQIKILPATAGDGTLRLEGQAPLVPLVADGDKCVLDSDALVLFAAAEILATTKAEVAQLKLTKAQNHLRRLLHNSGGQKRRNYSMGSSYGTTRSRTSGAVPYIDYIP
jgi:hypothetical protein